MNHIILYKDSIVCIFITHISLYQYVFFYRGDTAFCSLECREQQMKNDERKEKWSMEASKRDENHHHHHPPPPPPPPPATGTSQV